MRRARDIYERLWALVEGLRSPGLLLVVLPLLAVDSVHAAPPPVNGAWAVPGDGSVTMTWESVSTATSYNVYESTTSGTLGALVASVDAPATTAVLTGRTNATPYYYTVRAVDGSGESGDPVDTLSQVATMSAARFASQCNAVLGGSIYLFAVYDTAATQEIWKFDATTGAASLLSETMPAADMDCGAATRNGAIHLLGGGANYTATTNAIRRFVPGAPPATRAETLPSARFELPALTLRNGLVYAFGGRTGGSSVSNVLQYDPVAGTNATSVTTFSAGRAEASASSHHGDAIVAGGYRCKNSMCTSREWLTEVFSYDPVANTLVARTALPAARSGAGMTNLNDHSYLFGGITSSTGTMTNAILRFDDRANAWSTLSSTLPVASAYHAVKRIRGYIYLVGGWSGAPMDTVLRFSPGGQARAVPAAPLAATAPGTPSFGVSGSTVTVSWSAGSSVMQYRVFRSAISGQRGVLVEEQRGIVDDPATSLVDSSVADGTWYYTVTGIGFDERETQASAQASVTVGSAPPANTALPTISGTTIDGEVLSATTGTWTGADSYAYQWLSCDSAGGSCVAIASATANTYTLVSADVGSTIRVRVTATNAFGSTSADSAQTELIVASTISIAVEGYDATGAGPNTSPSTVSFGLRSPSDTAFAEVRVTVTTNDPDGYQLSMHDPDAGGAVDDGVGGGSIGWVGSGSVATPAAWSGAGVGVSTFGGGASPDRWCSSGQINCTTIDDPDLLWAPLTGTSQQVTGLTTATAGDTTRIPMRMTLSGTQVEGSYSGSVTIAALAIP